MKCAELPEFFNTYINPKEDHRRPEDFVNCCIGFVRFHSFNYFYRGYLLFPPVVLLFFLSKTGHHTCAPCSGTAACFSVNFYLSYASKQR
jgi:hypothetical protein